MLVLKSVSQKNIKYFFDEWKIYKKETIESGTAFRGETKGTLINTLEVSFKNPENELDALIKILADCCPPELTSAGIDACASYIQSLGTSIESLGYDSGDKSKIFIHTIQE